MDISVTQLEFSCHTAALYRDGRIKSSSTTSCRLREHCRVACSDVVLMFPSVRIGMARRASRALIPNFPPCPREVEPGEDYMVTKQRR